MKSERVRRTDKFGKPFEIGIGCAEDIALVLEMYCIFFPKPASQGLPPQDPETCQNWVKTLFEIGVNGLSWRGDSVIGHAVLIPDVKGKSGELVIFVDQNHRNLGIGTPEVYKPLNINRSNRERLLSKLEKSGRNTQACEVCGLTEPLEVHHIIDVAVIKKMPEIMSQIGLKSTDDIDNLIVLCENHHGKATKQKFYKSIFSRKIKSVQLREMILKMFVKCD